MTDEPDPVALRILKRFLRGVHSAIAFVFHSRSGSPLRETNVLVDSPHPALKAVGLPKAGMQAFRHGRNRRWELAAVKSRRHSSAHGKQLCDDDSSIHR